MPPLSQPFHTPALFRPGLKGAATLLLLLSPASPGEECLVLTPSARHDSATLADEYLALQDQMKLLNRAFYDISTSIHTYASPRCPKKRLMKLDERLLTLHGDILLREKTPTRLHRELASILKELSRWRVSHEVEVTQMGRLR